LLSEGKCTSVSDNGQLPSLKAEKKQRYERQVTVGSRHWQDWCEIPELDVFVIQSFTSIFWFHTTSAPMIGPIISWLSLDNLYALAYRYHSAQQSVTMSHPKKEIAAAIEYARSKGWRVVKGGSHAWGQMYCPYNDKECRCGEFCRTSIWSTPKSPGNHAKQLRRVVDNCSMHRAKETRDDEEQP